MKKNKVPRAPAHLSPEARRLWKALLSEWRIDDAGSIKILQVGLESFDRSQVARKVLAEEGMSVKDRWNVAKLHPLCAVIRDAEAAFRSALRQIGCDKSTDAPPPPRPGRPGSGVY